MERRKHSTHNAALAPEFAAHKLITKYLVAVVYFADPYASWQKGTIENTDRLIRQYIPKHTNFDEIADKKVASLQKKINSRPRKKNNVWNTKSRVLQTNSLILHLPVDSTYYVIFLSHNTKYHGKIFASEKKCVDLLLFFSLVSIVWILSCCENVIFRRYRCLLI